MSAAPPKRRPPIPRLEVHAIELACGATLLVAPRPGAEVCAVQVHVRGGHSLDAPGKEGTAHLAGSLLDQGTGSFSEEEIARTLEPVGASLHGSSTGLSGQVPVAHWKTLGGVLASCLREPTYPRAKVELHRRRLLDRLLVERDEPSVRGAWLFRQLVYGKHWLGRPDYGSLESVARIGRADLVRHHARHHCARRTVIAWAGDLDPKGVARFLDRELKDWSAGRPLGPIDRRFPALQPRVDAFSARRQQVHVFLGHLGVERTHPDYPALVVMDHVLGTGPGFTSRITRKLRDEQGLAYTVHAAIHASAGVLPGTFTAYIGTSPEHLETAVRGFLGEIALIQAEPVLPAELDLARSYLTGSYALGHERSARCVQAMISAHRNGLPDDHLEELVRAIERTTADDVQRVARTHLHPDKACLVAAGPVTRRGLRKLLAR